MKNKIWFICLICVCLLITGCGKKEEEKPFVISVESLNDGAHFWGCNVANEEIAYFDTTIIYDLNETTSKIDFKFIPVKEGNTKISFFYNNGDINNVEKTVIYDVTISSNLRAYIDVLSEE